MENNINKTKYQWQYVIVAVILALVICGSFMFVKHKKSQTVNNGVDSTIKITSTTAPITGKPDVIGKEKSRTTTLKQTTESSYSLTEAQTRPSNNNDNENTTQKLTNEDTSNTLTKESTKDENTTQTTQPETSNVG